MDLKVNYVSMVADIGNFDGSIFDLVLHLRERAISDLVRLCDTQTGYSKFEFEDSGNPVFNNVAVEARDGMYLDDEEKLFLEDTEDTNPPQSASSILDTALATKIGKFQTVIAYYDNIISLNGVTSATSPAQEAITKFKTLEGVYTTYGTFSVSNTFTNV